MAVKIHLLNTPQDVLIIETFQQYHTQPTNRFHARCDSSIDNPNYLRSVQFYFHMSLNMSSAFHFCKHCIKRITDLEYINNTNV